MSKINKIFLLSIFVIFGFLVFQSTKAGVEHNVFGYAWSENIGWISFNCTNTGTCATVNYGVNINSSTGIFSGYAWSENIGWISFNSGDLSGCPSGTCETRLDIGTGNISGWAKVLNSSDGWIKFSGSNYNSTINKLTGYFSGWAWGSDVVGWISLAGTNYKVQTSFAFNSAPIASFACDSSNCTGGVCNITDWIAYRPVADPTPCIYTIKNTSTDDSGITKSEWFMKKQIESDSAYVLKTSCFSRCNYTPQDMIADNYSIRLRVEDSQGLSSFIDHSFVMREEIRAGFMCSLDNVNWRTCDYFAVSENELVYFKDDQPSEHSDPSSGAVITSRIWAKDGVQFSSSTNPSTTITKTEKTIRLTIVDSNGHTDYIEHNLSVKMNLPDWQEIAPF